MAVYVLQHTAQIFARNRQIVIENLQILKDWIAQEPRADLVLPKYVSVSCVQLDLPVATEPFCRQLLDKTGVLLVPGERFDLPGYVRLGYCAKQGTLKIGLKKLSQFLRRYDHCGS